MQCPAVFPGAIKQTKGEKAVPDNGLSVSVAEEAEDPACIPIFWVSKWVDYSDKYGLGRFLPQGMGGSRMVT